MVNLFDVGTADAAGSHSEEHFAFATLDPGAHMVDGQVRIALARRPGRFNWSNGLTHGAFRLPQRLISFQVALPGLPARQRKNPENAPAIALRCGCSSQAGSTPARIAACAPPGPARAEYSLVPGPRTADSYREANLHPPCH